MEDEGQDIFPVGDVPDLTSEPIGTPDDQRPPEAKPPEAPWWKQRENDEIEYTASGKAIKEPLAKVLQRAQMGYNYAQNMADFNRQKSEFEQGKKTFEADADWKEISDYAKQDPDWAQHTRDMWEKRQAWRTENQNDPTLLEINRLKAELAPVKSEFEAWKQERDQAKIEKENQELDAEIKTVGEKYAKIGVDLSSMDESTGLSMESTVVDYAYNNGIKSFKTAFLEVYGDKIEARREESLKAQWVKEQATRTKQGFIGRTPTPTQGKRAEISGNRSFDDGAEEAKAALKAGHY